MPARRFEAFEASFQEPGNMNPGEQHHMTTAIGLALRGINRGVVKTNLRQEEFSVHHRLQEVRGKLIFLCAALAFVVALGAADMLISLHAKESRYQALKQEVRQVFKETFPDIRNVVDELQQARVRIREEKNRASLLGGFLGQDSMMDILEAVHQAIPKQLQVRITDLNADEKWVLLSGETNAFDVVDKVKASLSAFPLFQDVKIESAKMSKIAGVVEFKFKAQRK